MEEQACWAPVYGREVGLTGLAWPLLGDQIGRQHYGLLPELGCVNARGKFFRVVYDVKRVGKDLNEW